MTKCFKILIPIFLSTQLLFAQNEEIQIEWTEFEKKNKYKVENITISEGLHNNFIYDVLQDSQGFLWLATGYGVQKYNGYTFTFYAPDPSDPASQEAFGLYEDKNKNLWIQMETGISRYRRESDEFVKY